MSAPTQMAKHLLQEKNKKDLQKQRNRRKIKQNQQLVLTVSADFAGKKTLVKQAGLTIADIAKANSLSFNSKLLKDENAFIANAKQSQVEGYLNAAEKCADFATMSKNNMDAKMEAFKAGQISSALSLNLTVQRSLDGAAEGVREDTEKLLGSLLDSAQELSDLQRKLFEAEKAGNAALVAMLEARLKAAEENMKRLAEEAKQAGAAAADAAAVAAAAALQAAKGLANAVKILGGNLHNGLKGMGAAIGNAMGAFLVQFPYLKYIGTTPVTFCTGYAPLPSFRNMGVYSYETGEVFMATNPGWPRPFVCHEGGGLNLKDFIYDYDPNNPPSGHKGFAKPIPVPNPLVQLIFFEKPLNDDTVVSPWFANLVDGIPNTLNYMASGDIYHDIFVKNMALKIFFVTKSHVAYRKLPQIMQTKMDAHIGKTLGYKPDYSDIVRQIQNGMNSYKCPEILTLKDFKQKYIESKRLFNLFNDTLVWDQARKLGLSMTTISTWKPPSSRSTIIQILCDPTIEYVTKLEALNPQLFMYTRDKGDAALTLKIDYVQAKLSELQTIANGNLGDLTLLKTEVDLYCRWSGSDPGGVHTHYYYFIKKTFPLLENIKKVYECLPDTIDDPLPCVKAPAAAAPGPVAAVAGPAAAVAAVAGPAAAVAGPSAAVAAPGPAAAVAGPSAAAPVPAAAIVPLPIIASSPLLPSLYYPKLIPLRVSREEMRRALKK